MNKLNLAVVAYKPDVPFLDAMIMSILDEAKEANYSMSVHLWDNSIEDEEILSEKSFISELTIKRGGGNIGFGAGLNKLLLNSDDPLWLVMNQDAVLIRGALTKAISIYEKSSKDIAVFEFRQSPFEHPKKYDPVSLETAWFSGAAFLVRTDAFKRVGGFEERLFMYSEDVDLSFRMRAKGYHLRYMPDCLVLHNLFSHSGKQKPAQVKYDKANNLLLRARYGGWSVILLGISMYLLDAFIRMLKSENTYFFYSLKHILKNFIYFYRSGRNGLRNPGFVSEFKRWKYIPHRLGCASNERIEFNSRPFVSIIIRTKNRNHLFRQALQSVLNQTYDNLEVVVVDDGNGSAHKSLESYEDKSQKIRYIATGGVGRAKAGNLGLDNARGEFIGFLDDDDQLYADHVETLLSVIISTNTQIAYGWAEEVITKYRKDSDVYEEIDSRVRYKCDFSRILLWYKNYLPIQSVLFHRELYNKLGGFDESIDYYEDWSLWVKYSTIANFSPVHKVTSRYRVPYAKPNNKIRNKIFLEAYTTVADKHHYQNFTVSPQEFRRMVKEYLSLRGVFYITKDQLIGLNSKILKWLS